MPERQLPAVLRLNEFQELSTVQKKVLFIPALALSLTALAQAQAQPSKVGIIHIQNAIIGTKDGQKAVQELQAKFEPTSKKLESMREEINSLQAELSKGSNTMGEERRRDITRDIDQKTRSLNRATEDAQAEFQQEQDRLLQDLGQRMMAVIGKYSRDNGFTLILDVSNPQTPVLYAANGIDITPEIVKLYDEEAGKAATAGAAPAAPSPAPAK
jgi:outer membrane protein